RFPQYGTTGLPPAPADLNQDGTPDPIPGRGLYPDVDGDGKVTLGDALAIVNKINQQEDPPGGEGERDEALDLSAAPLPKVGTDTAVNPMAAFWLSPSPSTAPLQGAAGEPAQPTDVTAGHDALRHTDRPMRWLAVRDQELDDLAVEIAHQTRSETAWDAVLCLLTEVDLLDARD
ncbi:MAG: hypothetical protein CL681_06830, partial [Blastopirellula sp.]|nr:hypothetical protein [Blastopirellula sp.]